MSALTTPVLVLNRNWEAIRFVDAAQALCYLVRGVAEAVDPEDDRFSQHNFASWQELSDLRAAFEPEKHSFVRTVKRLLAVPQIVRLIHYKSRRRHRPRLNRWNIYARDGNVCQYCGKKFATRELNLDHVVPRCQGGGSTWSNLVCSCVACNTRKAGRTPVQAGMTLIRHPTDRPFQGAMPRVHLDSWSHFVDAAYWQVDLVD